MYCSEEKQNTDTVEKEDLHCYVMVGYVMSQGKETKHGDAQLLLNLVFILYWSTSYT